MATIIAPATGLPTEISDPVDTAIPVTQADSQDTNGVVLPQTTNQTNSTEDAGSAYDEAGLNVLQPGYDEAGVTVFPKTKTTTPTADVTAPRIKQQIVDNPLLNYESYTYNLSLHAISINDYNNLVGNPDGYSAKNVLVAGAGRYNESFNRNEFFKGTDFFFDNFKMRTIINTTKRNKFSNLIECQFTIIEPVGFTFLQRLMDATMGQPSQGGLGGANYLKMPFILQIDFFGHKHGEEANSYMESTLKDHTKRIPIGLVSMKTRITSKGTEYQIQAVPYNHTAFNPKTVISPADFKIKAKTVQDMFGKGFEVSSTLTDTAQREQDSIAAGRNLADAFGPGTVVADTGFSSVFANAGLCDGLNAWWEALKTKNRVVPNKFQVLFDEEIGTSSLNELNLGPVDVSKAATTDNAKAATQSAAGANKAAIKFDSQEVFIPAGTSIGAAIEWALTNSRWMKQQIFGDGEVETGTKDQTKQLQEALKLVKIIPKVEIGEYDAGRGDYSYRITFFVKIYKVSGRSDNSPQGRTPGFVKEYNYLYTGGTSPYTGNNLSNKDVIDLQIDFNMLFYTQITAFKNKLKQQATGAGIGVSVSDVIEQTSAQTGNPDAVASESTRTIKIPGIEDRINQSSVNIVSNNIRTAAAGASNPAGRVAASDILNNQLLGTAGDMINVKMRIIGDPTFIKQDDIFYNQGVAYATSMITPNNSIIMDENELYVYLTFMSPTDYDETTGLANPNTSKFQYNEFSGVYKIITIENEFNRGKFEQVLDMVRLPINDQARLLSVANQDRADSLIYSGIGQQSAFPTLQNFGPRIVQANFSGGMNNVNGLLAQGAGMLAGKLTSDLINSIRFSGASNVVTGIIDDVKDFLGFADEVVPTDFSVVGSFSTDITDYADVGLDAFGGSGTITPPVNLGNIPDDFWV